MTTHLEPRFRHGSALGVVRTQALLFVVQLDVTGFSGARPSESEPASSRRRQEPAGYFSRRSIKIPDNPEGLQPDPRLSAPRAPKPSKYKPKDSTKLTDSVAGSPRLP